MTKEQINPRPTRIERMQAAIDRSREKAEKAGAEQRAVRILEILEEAALFKSGKSLSDAGTAVYNERKADPADFSRRALNLADYQTALTQGEFGIPKHVVSHAMFVIPGEVILGAERWASARELNAQAVANGAKQPEALAVEMPVVTVH